MLRVAEGTLKKLEKNLLEVIQIHLEETTKLGTLKAFLEDAGYDLNTSQPTLQNDPTMVEIGIAFHGNLW